MKKRSLLALAILGTTALLSGGQSAKAALVYSPGDLFLGFHQGSESSYLINIGNFSLYSQRNGATFTVNTGGTIRLDLNTAFGTSWINSGTVQWGVVGTTFNDLPDLNVIYASKQRTTPGVQSSPLKAESNAGQTPWRANVVGLSNKYKLDGTATANSTKATFQDGGSTGSNTYASFTQTSNDFGIGNIEGTFTIAAGTSGSVLDLYRLDPGFGQDGTYLGSFKINDNGIVTFTAVPEPTTIALLVAASIMIGMTLRRRSKQSTN